MRDVIGAFIAVAVIGTALDLADDLSFKYFPATTFAVTASQLNNDLLPDVIPLRLGSMLLLGGLGIAGILYLASRAQ